jgi:hypothetical protein|mmetsp:Transcript_29124/g.52068  ORF Transcript_29124/g.52068 Transcript_29124/m.52068 type:complete len:90 (-) Transcript_29124:376-645(-)|eukprot:CAMPEP_0168608896 /NCGR_PEP_ID=MMETSP0449_2-20121227/898_1 /TAXON_ID=1082188 /ORGANISM="Strombidium rassoulzadegani, Strain ras09" /LENGTH=89 /DNA_ID=CAMNT_0008648965 /DNA_START=72 /DNA_END=341 /DNA_ORIENTATION=-
MSAFIKHIGTLKPAEVWPYVRSTARYENLSPKFMKWVHDYKVANIDTGSAKPLKDVMVGVFCVAYVFAWPTEYSHWKHAQEARKNGESH